MDPGVLVLAATPIGNVRDASRRLAAELAGADLVAAEDTRRLRRLLTDLDIRRAGPVVSYHEHNEATRAGELVARLLDGERVLLVTDAGMPAVSDPGYRLVAAAAEAGIPVSCVPGPSAVLVALALSGLPTDRFCFEGFLPRRAGERRKALGALATESRTMVFFEAPHRLPEMLRDATSALGAQRRGAVCRELTKTWEQVRRGTLAQLAEWATAGVKGEITVVVGGHTSGHRGDHQEGDLGRLVDGILARVAAGERLKDVTAEVAATTGIARKRLYDTAVGRRQA